MASLGMDIGLRALLTSQSALETIGHNISNANTPGYSRQTLDVGSVASVRIRNLLMGAGVQAQTVRRTADSLLQARLVMQGSSLARLDGHLDVLGQAEGLFGSADTGLGARMQAFFGSLSTLSSNPEDASLRRSATQSADALAEQFNSLSGGLEGLGSDVKQGIEARVEQVNTLAARIVDLNRSIVSAEGGGGSANDLRDQRDQALRELSELIDVRPIEDPQGSVRVLLGGSLLVSSAGASRLSLDEQPDGTLDVRLGGHSDPVAITGGAIGGMLQGYRDTLPELALGLDGLARQWILELNRAHSTGLPLGGPFRRLDAANAVQDANGDGNLTDELLAQAGLPFEVQSGTVQVNVTDLVTGAVEKHALAIDAGTTTVGDLLNALNSVAHLSAGLDAKGRVQLFADPGYGFDFSARLDPDPDAIGAFGGGKASLGSAGAGPFAIGGGDTLDLVGPAGPFTITFNASDFAQPGQATADELAAAINADPGAQANGLAASSVDGRLVLQSVGTGAGESFTVASGSALGALGWSASQTVVGADVAASVSAGGAYTGTANDRWTFVPSGDGTIGTTPGLQVLVYDQSGAQIAALDVGAGYTPGDAIAVADGVEVRFGFGDLSATDHDVFALDVTADSDTADLLPALGLNSLFTGSDAATIALREDIAADPSLLAASQSGDPGDAGGLLALLAVDDQPVDALGGATLSGGWAELTGGVGLAIEGAQDARDTEDYLMTSLQSRRDELSGVNVDEELVAMMASEQAYAAASQYIRVTSQLSDELLNIL